jgi:hypothetical protein
MASEVKYKKGGGNSCAGNGCSNNHRKLNEWKQTFCELHKQKHDDCSYMIPYRLHTMPSKESIRLQWANALNRKSLPKQDGKPTERNPIPDNLSWGMKKRQLLAGENL